MTRRSRSRSRSRSSSRERDYHSRHKSSRSRRDRYSDGYRDYKDRDYKRRRRSSSSERYEKRSSSSERYEKKRKREEEDKKKVINKCPKINTYTGIVPPHSSLNMPVRSNHTHLPLYFRTNTDILQESEIQEKKQRLEAWKKKIASQNLLEKLNKEKEALRKKQEELKKQEETKEQEATFSISSGNSTLQKSQQNEVNAFGISMNSNSEKKPIQTLDLNEKEEEKKEEEEEIDSLDAYMSQIEKEVKKLPNFHQEQTITLDEIVKKKNEKPEENNEVDEDEFHRKFIEAVKNKTSEKENKIGVLMESDDDDDEMVFSEKAPEEEKKRNKKELKQVDHSKISYPPFRKAFYIPPKDIEKMTKEEIKQLRKSLDNIRVHGKGCPAPITNWNQCGLNDTILKVIEKLGFTKPFPIQAQAIPAIMSGRNVIGCAKTGSGKTLAFLLPMLRHVLDQPDLEEGDGPIGLVIAPTRELAVQIYTDLKKFSRPLGLRAACCYGGASIADQIARLKRGAHIVVCTPGRMIDLLCANRGRVTNLRRVTYVVLDEADRMVDMGFGPQIQRIVGNIRPDRQIVMFSATFPKTLEAYAKTFMEDPIEIVVGGKSVACDKVTQFVEIRTEDTKFLRLLSLLGIWHDRGNILIFVDKQQDVDMLFKDLLAAGYKSLTLHAGMEQLERAHTINSFKKKEVNILISTSVAARGLDVKDLNLVINYDCPNHYEDYVHRVGRTGRAGKEGTAYTFITPDEERFAPDLVKALQQSGNKVPEDLKKMAEAYLEKKKKGLVSDTPKLAGYKTKGFKFDEAEANKKKEEIKRQKRELGLDDSDDDEDEVVNEDGEKQPSSEILAKITPSKPPVRPEGKLNPQLAIANARAYATAIAIQNNLQQNGEKKHYEVEIEINDFPQQARWKVTHKDALYEITENTGATITTKGMYFPPGTKVPPGERKLYLLVEGPTEEIVQRAKAAIVRILEEATAATAIATKQRVVAGRYQVL